MKNSTTKVIFLLLAFVLPVCVFVFLKLFGRNEFDVPPLFVTEAPPVQGVCDFKPSLPYFVPGSIRNRYQLSADSLTVIFFEPRSGEALNQLDRIREQTGSDPVKVIASIAANAPATTIEASNTVQTNPDTILDNPRTPSAETSSPLVESDAEYVQRCIFFLDTGVDVVMLDSRGAIRGQYAAGDREEMDRLLTEITIILKKY